MKRYERRALELLCYSEAIWQEADRRNISTKGLLRGDPAATEVLLGKLALVGVKPDYLRKVHKSFKVLLAHRDIAVGFALSESARDSILNELKSGSNLKTACEKYGSPWSANGKYELRNKTQTELIQEFGPVIGDRFSNMEVGQKCEMIATRQGYLFAQATQISDGFEELRPEIERQIAQSRKILVLSSIVNRSTLSSNLGPIQNIYRPASPDEEPPPPEQSLAMPAAHKSGAPIEALPPLAPGTSPPDPGIKFNPTGSPTPEYLQTPRGNYPTSAIPKPVKAPK